MKNIRIIIQGFALILILISCEKQRKFEYPLVYTGDVTDITDTSALFSANISCLGDYPILESGFIWGVHSNDNYGIKIKNTEDVDGIYSLSTNEKLLPGKTYYVRAYVQTKKTISYGREVSFESLKGQIDIGKWSNIYKDNSHSGSCEIIKTSFTINNLTYFAFEGNLTTNGDLFSYDTENNTFNFELSNDIISGASYSVAYNGNAYIFYKNAFYKFDPQTKSFTKLSVLDVNANKYWVSGFRIADNLYIGLGTSSTTLLYDKYGYSKDFWKYNIAADRWEQIASFPGEYRRYCFSFSINNLGYVGGGFNQIQGRSPNPQKFNELWCYYPEANKWIQKESLPFKNEEYYSLIGTNTESFGYCYYHNLFYEYNPVFDIWEKMADLNDWFCYPHIYAIGSKVFVLGALSYDKKKNLNIWRYEK